MSRIARLAGAFGLTAKIATAGPAIRYVSSYDNNSGGDSFKHIEKYLAAAQAYNTNDLFYLCGNRLGNMAASSQMLLYPPDAPRDPDTGEFRRDSAINDHPLYDLLATPNNYFSRAEWLKQVVLVGLLSDTGVIVHLDDGKRVAPKRNTMVGGEREIGINGPPVALWTLFPPAVEKVVEPNSKKLVDGFRYTAEGNEAPVMFLPEAVMWMREFNPLDFMASLSVATPASRAMEFDRHATEANLNMFRHGMRPGPMVESDHDIVSPAELSLMQQYWTEYNTGVDNWHKILPVWGGFKFKQFGFTPEEAEFIEGEKMARMRIFGVMGVHPALIMSEDVNRADAREGEFFTAKYTLLPILDRLATKITASIIPLFTADGAQPCVARFVNVVPRDATTLANIAQARAGASNTMAQAVSMWVGALGIKYGLVEAQRTGALSREANIEDIQKAMEKKQKEMEAAQQAAMQPQLPAGSPNGTKPAGMGRGPDDTPRSKAPARGQAVRPDDGQSTADPAGKSLTVKADPINAVANFVEADGSPKPSPIAFTIADAVQFKQLFEKNYPQYAGLATVDVERLDEETFPGAEVD